MTDDAILQVSLAPDPTIEAYKKDVDRTLIVENLKFSTEERVRRMFSALRLAEEIRGTRRTVR
jgi:hypothetical protein